MRVTLLLCVLTLFTMSCGLFSGSSTPTSNAVATNESRAAAKMEKVIDVPSLMGKSIDEIKQVVGAPPKFEMKDKSNIEFRIPNKYDLSVDFKNGKAEEVSFTFPTGISAFTVQQVADVTGIDIAGKKPDSEDLSFITYKKVSIAGSPKDVTFNQVGTTFRGVRVSVPYK